MDKPLILIADDDKAIRLVLEKKFKRSGFNTKTTDKGKTLLSWVEQGEGDLIITDVIMEDSNGLDLLPYYQNDTLHTTIPNLVDQVIEMFEFFAKHKVYKINNSLSNMTVKNNQLIAFDFKWAQDRPNWKFIELYGYKEWMSKIDNKLPEILEKLA